MRMRITGVAVVLVVCATAAFAQDSLGKRVTPQWLESNLQMDNMRIIDTRPMLHDYWAGHIPGAVWLSQEALRLPNHGTPAMLTRPRILAQMLGEMGIKRETLVIVAGQADDDEATYVLWALEAIGHERFAMLSGGMKRWIDEGRVLTQEYPEIEPVHYPARERFVPSVYATLPEVIAAVRDDEIVLLDCRLPLAYVGEMSWWARPGHIPTAINVPYAALRTETGTWRSPDELQAYFDSLGLEPTDRIIVSCGKGLHSSGVYFALKHILGYPRVENYDGSYSQWSVIEKLQVTSMAPE